MQTTLRADHLSKSFKSREVVKDVSIAVHAGEVVGLLGPNGAGKTTTVRILATLLRPDSGSAKVAGIDVFKEPDEVRKVIGLSGQYAAVDEILTGYDNLVMFGKLYHLGNQSAIKRADELLERFSLTEAAKRPIKTYSGGMRRRLDLAASLIVKPKVLFLDEPTASVDDITEEEITSLINEIALENRIIVLSSHRQFTQSIMDEVIYMGES